MKLLEVAIHRLFAEASNFLKIFLHFALVPRLLVFDFVSQILNLPLVVDHFIDQKISVPVNAF